MENVCDLRALSAELKTSSSLTGLCHATFLHCDWLLPVNCESFALGEHHTTFKCDGHVGSVEFSSVPDYLALRPA